MTDLDAFSPKEIATVVLALERHRSWLMNQAEKQTGVAQERTLEHVATTESASAKWKQYQRERIVDDDDDRAQ